MINLFCCEVCGKTRQEKGILVLKKDVSAKFGIEDVVVMRNVNYCADSESCFKGAKTIVATEGPAK